jgi:hypothetical protein
MVVELFLDLYFIFLCVPIGLLRCLNLRFLHISPKMVSTTTKEIEAETGARSSLKDDGVQGNISEVINEFQEHT